MVRSDDETNRRALFEAILGREGIAPRSTIRRRGQSVAPLSAAQRGLWLFHRMQPENPCYNSPAAFHVEGQLDPATLERSLRRLMQRHEALRAVFVERDGVALQEVKQEADAALAVVDLRGLGEASAEEAAWPLAARHAAAPFDLGRGPVVRVALLRTGEATYVLAFNIHHIVFDAWSVPILLQELTHLYAVEVGGAGPELDPLPIQFGDYALWQEERIAAGELAKGLQRWRERLSDLVPLELATSQPRSAERRYRGAAESIDIDPELATALRSLAQRSGATLFATALAPFSVLLGRYSRRTDVILGAPTANRTAAELEGLIGYFVNMVALRMDLSGDPTWIELIERAQDVTSDALTHQDVPIDLVIQDLQLQRTPTRHPLFDISFALHEFPLELLQLAGCRVRPVLQDPCMARFDLEVHIIGGRDRLEIVFRYDVDLFDAATIRRMLGHYVNLLTRMAAQPDRAASAHEMLTEDEERLLISELNATRRPIPDCSLPELVEAQAEQAPDRVAVTFGDHQISYATLNRRANELARALLREGDVGPDSLVGICLPRSIELVIAVLAVLKTGAGYLPLDPVHPVERLRLIVEDVGPPLVVTRAELPDRLPPATPAPRVDGPARATPCDGRNLPRRSGPDNLAYVIYTSGSTGRPKGIAMPQRTLLNLLAWQDTYWPRRGGARTVQFASLNFDLSFQDIFGTLAGGGTLVLTSEEQRRDPRELAEVLVRHGARRLYIVTVVLEQLAAALDSFSPADIQLEQVIAGGEQLRTTGAIKKLFDKLEGCTLSNEYGPSETHAVTALELRDRPERWPKTIPIGKPIANARMYLLDPRMRLVPYGLPGEVYVAGDCLARGYVRRPGVTAERFLPDPFSGVPGARMYRSGDLVRYVEGGALEFVDRVDRQVKIRGHAVEPGEVEAVLVRHPAVADAVIMVKGHDAQSRRLVAYWTPNTRLPRPTEGELRQWLKERLPDALVPSAFVSLDVFPLTPTGKVDRGALPPEPAPVRSAPSVPEGPIEAAVAAIWAEILGVDEIGRDDNFFDLGGHSLLATRVISHIEEIFGVVVPLRVLFASSTVRTLTEQMIRIAGGRSTLEETARIVLDVAARPDPTSSHEEDR